ncbi:MAG: methyltransferase [Pseudomonadota bacterium]
MTQCDEAVDHGFLDGRLRILQPAKGYRAATDPVLLAAAAPVRPGQSVLDLGAGVGTASLCLAHRVPGLEIHGLELQQEYAILAERNAAANAVPMQIHQGDVRNMPADLRQRSFDHVISNPPWHDAHTIASPIVGRDTANRLAELTLASWITAALARLRPGGWLTIIQRAVLLPEILSALSPRTGDIGVLPLQAREGRDAKRVIVKARKGSRGPFRIAAPLVLHTGSTHVEDGDDFSPVARAILRDGAGLDF